ncbi:MAG: hypothetical protein HDR86_05775 [Bacteroides sp.]|nr:hypothetical protein [Bacteroides sp.]
MNPKKFYATTSWAKSTATLPDKVRLEVYDAMFAYVETGEVPKMSSEARAAFAFIRTDIDMEIEKNISVCAKRLEAVNKRWNRTEK